MSRVDAARERLIETMQDRGITDLAVLQAFSRVPRHAFVPEAVRHRAYDDAPVPIGFGQTASQPSLQALYMQRLGIEAGHRILEIGTGSGYQTAVLAILGGHVYSVERIAGLAQRARRALDEMRFNNVAILVGDGTLGWAKFAPYDRILVAAGSPTIPQALVDQLAPDGAMAIPVGDREMQTLVLVRKDAQGNVTRENVTECTFVPLVGRFAWAESGDSAQ
ncbi:MAG TPA: protein-L-isoaspartate(D-aspartate) O-methyltransferase [Longimicrobiales bacterium]